MLFFTQTVNFGTLNPTFQKTTPNISTCSDHNRYRWIKRDSGAIMSENRYTTTPHCLSIPDPTNIKLKQQVVLAPCDDSDPSQLLTTLNGMLVAQANNDVCVMWNMLDKTRLWAHPCGAYRFSAHNADGTPDNGNILQSDKTLRPYGYPDKCLYHKMNGYTRRVKR